MQTPADTILTLDLSGLTGRLGLYLVDEDKMLAAPAAAARESHLLHQRLVDLLAEHQLELDDITHFAITSGPGSFTGLRVALSFVEGLTLLNEKPAIGIPTLTALAASWLAAGKTTIAVTEAHGGQVYTQRWDGLEPVSEPAAMLRADLTAELPASCQLCGDAVLPYQSEWPASVKLLPLTEPAAAQVDLRILGQLAVQQIKTGDIPPRVQLTYVKALQYQKLSEQGVYGRPV